jgi:hypothetical protein
MGNKVSFTASPKKKKAKQFNVDSAEAVTTVVIDVDFEKDINATQQLVSASSVEVFGIMAMNEDEEDKEKEAGEEDATDSTGVPAKGLLEVTMNNEVETTPLLKDPPQF